jgi:hypothetical protein
MKQRWSWSKETEWTESGNRLLGEASDGVLYLAYQSQALVVVDGAARRQIWNRGKLCIPLAQARSEVERLAAHWLAFFGDPVLSQAGIAFCREVFESAELVASAPSAGRGPSIMH